jgi:hypothetical protein
MSLNALEQHIKTNQHLPGIPSEKEVIENGIEIGDISASLLEKIEELTLYIIEQDKRSNTLMNKINLLEEEIEQLQSAK